MKICVISASILMLAALDAPTNFRIVAAQPDKNLRPIKITLEWNANNLSKDVAGYRLFMGGITGIYTNATFTPNTNAVATVMPGSTYYFRVQLVTTTTNNGKVLLVDGINPTELAYTVPRKGPQK